MVWHDAVGVHGEVPCRRFRTENLDEPATCRGVGKYSTPAEAAKGHKIILAPSAWVEANIFVKAHVWAGRRIKILKKRPPPRKAIRGRRKAAATTALSRQ